MHPLRPVPAELPDLRGLPHRNGFAEGRIALMRAASDGRIEPDGAYQTHINLCLMCRACEQACPSGVQYGTMIEIARVALEESRRPGPSSASSAG
jgi:Fe-S oxidoreductase